MSEEQIPGVPEGYRLVHASRQPTNGESYLDIWGKVQIWTGTLQWDRYCAIIERIPKPKKWVQICEWDLAEREYLIATGWVIGHTGASGYQIQRVPDRSRIEERDA